MKQTFRIDGRLPSYNELNKQPWYKSRRIKQQAMDTVKWYARAARVVPVSGRCSVIIACYEQNARRDMDNVTSGANKVVLDALQQLGILKGDGRKYINEVRNPRVEIDRSRPRVEVTLYDEA